MQLELVVLVSDDLIMLWSMGVVLQGLGDLFLYMLGAENDTTKNEMCIYYKYKRFMCT